MPPPRRCGVQPGAHNPARPDPEPPAGDKGTTRLVPEGGEMRSNGPFFLPSTPWRRPASPPLGATRGPRDCILSPVTAALGFISHSGEAARREAQGQGCGGGGAGRGRSCGRKASGEVGGRGQGLRGCREAAAPAESSAPSAPWRCLHTVPSAHPARTPPGRGLRASQATK